MHANRADQIVIEPRLNTHRRGEVVEVIGPGGGSATGCAGRTATSRCAYPACTPGAAGRLSERSWPRPGFRLGTSSAGCNDVRLSHGRFHRSLGRPASGTGERQQHEEE